MKPTIEINEANFEREVLQSDQPVLVDFWAEWCGPCKMLAPVREEIAVEQAARVKVAKVNVDANPALAARFGIQSIPTLLYFVAGELRDKTIGAITKKRFCPNWKNSPCRFEPTRKNDKSGGDAGRIDSRQPQKLKRPRPAIFRLGQTRNHPP